MSCRFRWSGWWLPVEHSSDLDKIVGVLDDDSLPDYIDRIGVPGLVDIHVHFMPENVLHKVWAYFDRVSHSSPGPQWPITYRDSEEQRLDTLRRLGVVGHTALVYPHRAGMAEWLSDWALDFGARAPGCVPSATFYPEPGVLDYVTSAVQRGARVFKSHLQVGAYDPRDELLDPVWGLLAEVGVPVVCHCGSGPFPGPFTGPGPIGDVLSRHPALTLVVAHAGSPEYAEFLDLVEKYPNVHLDTTMAFTDYLNRLAPFPAEEIPRLGAVGDRVVLGSDFPNIPYQYATQIQALADLCLGNDWMRAVLHHNGARLLRL